MIFFVFTNFLREKEAEGPVQCTQIGNFKIFLLLRFYVKCVKSISVI